MVASDHRVALDVTCLPCYVPAMARKVYRALGPDVELVRQQMTLEPPDAGSVTVESDGDQITAVAWTHNGRRCSVSTAIVIDFNE